jgi:threonine/homoserine/homoserine lactone efflux protein
LIHIIINGILLGLILSLLIGPVFFYLIEKSISKGPRDAMFVDIGVVITDIVYLCIAYFSAAKINELLQEYTFIKYITGSVFIAIGTASIIKKKSLQSNAALTPLQEGKMKKENALVLISKGMALNAINPSVMIFWLGACSYAIEKHKIEGTTTIIYFFVVLGTMFGIDMLKIYFASKLKRYMTPRILSLTSIVVGIILIFFGIFAFFQDIKIN